MSVVQADQQFLQYHRVFQAVQDGVLAIEGFLEGIGENSQDIQEVEVCAKDAGTVITDVRNALDDFAGFNYIGGLQSLGGAINTFPGLLSACGSGFAELGNIIAHLFDPNLGWFIFVNAGSRGPALISSVEAGIGSFNSGNYKQFGFDIGQGLRNFFA